jgi:hypothetical protein
MLCSAALSESKCRRARVGKCTVAVLRNTARGTVRPSVRWRYDAEDPVLAGLVTSRSRLGISVRTNLSRLTEQHVTLPCLQPPMARESSYHPSRSHLEALLGVQGCRQAAYAISLFTVAHIEPIPGLGRSVFGR